MQENTMQEDLVQQIKSNPKYQELLRKRTPFSWVMAIIMLLIYYGFIMTIAFAPEVLGTPLGPDTIITIGIPIGIGVILCAFILTGIYVARSNSLFDRLVNEIKEEVL
jgi:uncharacterized membrane protein (DUF485 family)